MCVLKILSNKMFGLFGFSKTSRLRLNWENIRVNVENTLKHINFIKSYFQLQNNA